MAFGFGKPKKVVHSWDANNAAEVTAIVGGTILAVQMYRFVGKRVWRFIRGPKQRSQQR